MMRSARPVPVLNPATVRASVSEPNSCPGIHLSDDPPRMGSVLEAAFREPTPVSA